MRCAWYEVRPQYLTEWAAITAVVEKLGIGTAETLRTWVRKAEVGAGERPVGDGGESEELKRLKRENAELRRANEILRKRVFRAGARPETAALVEFVDAHRDRFGVEPICAALGFARPRIMRRRNVNNFRRIVRCGMSI